MTKGKINHLMLVKYFVKSVNLFISINKIYIFVNGRGLTLLAYTTVYNCCTLFFLVTPSKKLINQDQHHDKLVKTNSNLSINSTVSNLSSPEQTNSLSMISQETAVRRSSIVSDSTSPNKNCHSRSISGTQTFNVTTDTSVNVVSKLEPTEVKDVLVCFLFLLKYSSQDQLVSWWRYCSEQDIVAFFKIIE